MPKIAKFNPERVFKYFEDICAIPRGSGNMEKISGYCMDFAAKHSLEAIRDDANNVIIYKKASKGYEDSEAVILQGHLDMVCQKDEGVEIDFEKDGIDIYVDGKYIRARGTTLGADNGIAIAMIMAILESDEYEHPPIEAVFTTDEETGMNGAVALDYSLLKGRKMINLDSEEEGVITVSCAGGVNFEMRLPIERCSKEGAKSVIGISGLSGGHSGVDIDKGRANANLIMARLLGSIGAEYSFDIIDISGGDKNNAIPVSCKCSVVSHNPEKLRSLVEEYGDMLKETSCPEEYNCQFTVEFSEEGVYEVMTSKSRDSLLQTLLHTPNGVISMSPDIDGLVETSLNLGILKTCPDCVVFSSALRSNLAAGLEMLKERLEDFAEAADGKCSFSGEYPPWEYRQDSQLQKIYKEVYKEKTGIEPEVEAIHAGLECGLFAAALPGLDCISVGPDMYDIHTCRERISITSVNNVFDTIVKVLKQLI